MTTKKHNLKDEKLSDLADKIDETDEMKLKMLAALEKPEPEDILYPLELNAHLIEQLKVMTCENNGLRKLIFTRDEEIKQLNKTVTDLNQRIRDIISGTGPAISSKSAGVISAKITELCKQNRHLVADLEGYKTRNAALERKIMQLDLMNKEHEKLDICLCKADNTEASSDELKELNSKLASVNKKLFDSKNRNLELKNDILIATKILQQELGDKFTSIKELQHDLAGWKGRAQQIVLLQARINDLEEKLNGKHKDLIEAKRKDQNQVIRDLEMKRKKETELAMKELQSLKDENQELKKKLDGARSRVKNLEYDSLILRQKMQTFVEKSNHDDLLINEQRNQTKNLELYYQELLKESTNKMNRVTYDLEQNKKVMTISDEKIDALQKQALEKSIKIEELRTQLARFEECSLQNVFFTPLKMASDNEIKQLTELVNVLNGRLDSERHKWDELDVEHRKLREKKRKLEKKVSALEEEIKSLKDCKKNVRLSKTSVCKEPPPVDMSKLCSNFAKKLSSLASLPDKRSISTSESEVINDGYNVDKDEIKFKLILTEEKLKMMEDKLKMIEEEKRDDFIHLTEMIQNSKQLFNEALAVLQKEKCVCS